MLTLGRCVTSIPRGHSPLGKGGRTHPCQPAGALCADHGDGRTSGREAGGAEPRRRFPDRPRARKCWRRCAPSSRMSADWRRAPGKHGHSRGAGPPRVIPTLGPYLVPRLIPYLRERYPAIEIELKESLTDRLIADSATAGWMRSCGACRSTPTASSPGRCFPDRFYMAWRRTTGMCSIRR